MIDVSVTYTDGSVHTARVPDGHGAITSLRMNVDGLPVVVVPFTMHEDSRRLHTVCRRDSPKIDEVEW